MRGGWPKKARRASSGLHYNGEPLRVRSGLKRSARLEVFLKKSFVSQKVTNRNPKGHALLMTANCSLGCNPHPAIGRRCKGGFFFVYPNDRACDCGCHSPAVERASASDRVRHTIASDRTRSAGRKRSNLQRDADSAHRVGIDPHRCRPGGWHR